MAKKKVKPGPKTDNPVQRKSFTCTEYEWEKILEYADKWGWSASRVISYMVTEYMDTLEQG